MRDKISDKGCNVSVTDEIIKKYELRTIDRENGYETDLKRMVSINEFILHSRH